MDLYTWAIVIHVIGAVAGVGAVTVHDLQYFRAFGDKDLGIAFLKSSHFYGRIIQFGLALLVISGLTFMLSRPVLWGSEKIVTKLVLVGILMINGFFINFIHHPRLGALKGEDWQNKTTALKNVALSRLSFDSISLATWYSILFLGAVGRQPWQWWQIAIGYVVLVLISYLAQRTVINKKLIKNSGGD
jgi:hypothetical protein